MIHGFLGHSLAYIYSSFFLFFYVEAHVAWMPTYGALFEMRENIHGNNYYDFAHLAKWKGIGYYNWHNERFPQFWIDNITGTFTKIKIKSIKHKFMLMIENTRERKKEWFSSQNL